ncbi:pimeloyl-ACP methyl ester carboxylesterase [Neorhizobium galegae]|uniref:alpha/beta hydrolase family protein n=1 Tax=Neorhizobium galegae TaxID=399 RepID=UPI001AE7CDD9|nr:alpha/beta fold hydrolase [Neorhizobium galegae]MBP2549749.1 pimeloyl-ACP methyl ester carboxylesterase [Neorhizobium galegae]
MHSSTLKRAVARVVVTTILGSAAVAAVSIVPAGAAEEVATAGSVISHKPHAISPQIKGRAELIVHTMQSVSGKLTKASTLLFVPEGQAPKGGWPVIAWAHGTTTPGNKLCAPSLTDDLDGGLTKDGFNSDYLFEISTLVNAGYAVVAPDLEGLGEVAEVPYPYFNASSLARSLISGVVAAHKVNADLSNEYAAVGHSDGGHAVLGVEAYADEAPQFEFKGTVAIAPYTSIEAFVKELAQRTAANPQKADDFRLLQNFNVALMTTGLKVIDPSFEASAVMGPDLAAQLKDFTTRCSVPAIGGLSKAMTAKGVAFEGFKENWADDPKMAAFLGVNDPAANPNFRLRKPTFISLGPDDAFVFLNTTRALVARLKADGTPVTYNEYPGTDHFTVIRAAQADTMAFLKQRFAD